MMMDHFDEWWHDIYEISFAIMKYQLTSHQEWWNEIYEWWLVDKSWWTSASEEPSLEPAAKTSENFEKPAVQDTRLKDGWKRCLPQISMAMSGYIPCIYLILPQRHFLTKVDRIPFMPSLAPFSGRPTKTVFLMLCMRIFPEDKATGSPTGSGNETLPWC